MSTTHAWPTAECATHGTFAPACNHIHRLCRQCCDARIQATMTKLVEPERCPECGRLGGIHGYVHCQGDSPDSPPSLACPLTPVATSHTLTVFNAVDVPEAVQRQVMLLLDPYAPDIYQRACDAKGVAL